MIGGHDEFIQGGGGTIRIFNSFGRGGRRGRIHRRMTRFVFVLVRVAVVVVGAAATTAARTIALVGIACISVAFGLDPPAIGLATLRCPILFGFYSPFLHSNFQTYKTATVALRTFVLDRFPVVPFLCRSVSKQSHLVLALVGDDMLLIVQYVLSLIVSLTI